MDFTNDKINPRGAGTTYFHEFGHYIDFMAAGPGNTERLSTNSLYFGNLLKSDFDTYIKNYMKHKKLTKADAYKAISKEFMNDITYSVSDLFGGLSENKCVGKYGHMPEYWKNGALEREAFAHMFEAQFDINKYNFIKNYFPKALVEFEKLLKGVL